MASWSWEYGAAGTGLHFTITYDSWAQTFTVASLEGKFDLNALWWDNGVTDDGVFGTIKGDSALNMNGSGAEDWDGYAKLSSAGLGALGENKTSFISDGEIATFSLSDFGLHGSFDPATGGTLGVRATSVNGGDSVKLVDTTPEPGGPPPDNFPLWPQDISHVVLYFEQDTGDTTGDTGDPDGWYTVKIDNVPSLAGDDLDEWIDDVLQYLIANDTNIDATSDLVGAVIKGGNDANSTQFFAYGGHNTNGTAADAIPLGAPIIDYPPPQGAVNGPAIDASYDYGLIL